MFCLPKTAWPPTWKGWGLVSQQRLLDPVRAEIPGRTPMQQGLRRLLIREDLSGSDR